MIPHFTTVLRLAVGDAGITLWLAPDPSGGAPALARAFGHRLYYEGHVAHEGLYEQMAGLRRAWDGISGRADSSAAALDALRAAARRVGDGATLTVIKRLPPGQRVPHWVSRLRLGDPPASGAAIWPFDAELAGLEAGARQLLKREPHSLRGLEAERRWLEGRGLALRVVEPEGRPPVLFVAREQAVVDHAAAAEPLICGEGEASAEAARWLGDALGYPRCCTATFAALEGHHDLSLAVALLPPAGAPPASPLNLWLHGVVSATSHAHCSLACGPSATLADAVLDVLDTWRPGFRARFLDLAMRVHAIDADGRAWALAVEGDLATGDAVVREALELVPDPDGPVGLILREEAPLRGARASAEDDWLLVGGDGPGLTAALVADHRGV